MKKPSQMSSRGRPPGPETPPPPGGRKRTIAITLLAVGAGAVTIGAFSGLGSSSGDAQRTYKDIASCEAEKIIPADECRRNFTQAWSAHERSFQPYQSRDVCEKDYGAGNCTSPTTAGQASLFIPLMAGYMIAQRAGAYQAAPLYRRPGDPDGEFRQSAAFPFAASSSSSSSSSSSRGFSSSSTGSSSTRTTTGTTSGFTTTSRGGFGGSSMGVSGS